MPTFRFAMPAIAGPRPRPTERDRRSPLMPNTTAKTPSAIPITTRNGIQAMSVPMIPQVNAAVARPLLDDMPELW